MFDIGSSELLLIVIVAVVVIGPKDLPRVLYKVGQYVGKARAMTRHFRAGIDEMVRQAEMEEMEKKWAAQNARIMAESAVDGHGAVAEGKDDASAAIPADPTAASDGQPLDGTHSSSDHGGGQLAGRTDTAGKTT